MEGGKGRSQCSHVTLVLLSGKCIYFKYVGQGKGRHFLAHALKVCMGSRGITSLILDFGTRRISGMLPLNRRLELRVQSWSGYFREEKNLPLPEFKHQTLLLLRA